MLCGREVPSEVPSGTRWCSIALPALRPSDPGYKQPPLVDITRYKFVIIDILHLYLRVTDQLFVRCCNFMDKRQIGEFLAVCQHHKLSAFHLRDENGKLKFSNLDKSKRENMMEAVFLKEAVLRTLMPPSRADRAIAVVEKFQQVCGSSSAPTHPTSSSCKHR